MTEEPLKGDSPVSSDDHPTLPVTEAEAEPGNESDARDEAGGYELLDEAVPSVSDDDALLGLATVELSSGAGTSSATADRPVWHEAVDAIRELGERLERRLEALETRFDREIRAESTREKVVDRLHAELQEYKQDLLLNTLRPVFIDLIQLHDDIGKVAVAGDESPEEVRRLVVLMEGFQQGIEDILYRQGVEPFRVEGDAFDPRRQRAVSTVPTDDPGRAKSVASRLRKGFQSAEKVIRPEIVSVFAYKP
jgi:molecular chaperone GrpE